MVSTLYSNVSITAKPFFEKLGFNEAVHIEHWGNPSNATCMIGFIKEAG